MNVVESAIFFGVVCWSSSITAADRKRLNKLIRRASSVLRCSLGPVEVVGDSRMNMTFFLFTQAFSCFSI